MRSNARKQLRNRSIKTRLSTLERKFATLATAGKKPEAGEALKAIIGAFDKAAKAGVIHSGTADRKKSRLTLQLNRIGTAPVAVKGKAKA
jgi:small subunit ribosomal protein S20